MKGDKKVFIHSVLTHLAERDPEWAHPKMLPKFKFLYQGWRQKEIKHNVHSHLFYTRSWQRGWWPQADFKRFLEYAMQ